MLVWIGLNNRETIRSAIEVFKREGIEAQPARMFEGFHNGLDGDRRTLAAGIGVEHDEGHVGREPPGRRIERFVESTGDTNVFRSAATRTARTPEGSLTPTCSLIIASVAAGLPSPAINSKRAVPRIG